MALVVEFLTNIRKAVIDLNGVELGNCLLVENDVPEIYFRLAQDLRSSFPNNGGDALKKTVDKCLPIEDAAEGKGSPWPGFQAFMTRYLEYWRDVDFDNLVSLHANLSDLHASCANAFNHPSMGVTLLQTCLSLSESMSRLVIGLTSQPELMAKIRDGSADNDPDKSLVELTAETIQKIFTSCLGDRTSGRFTPPKGKKTHVYLFANLTLRLLFACGKSRFAVQMFTNLSASGPALSLYPASQRVTFLYNLGRFYFDFDHFYRAHMCLEEAYRQCPPAFQKHRRQILTFWIPSNLLLGRFPSAALLQRPEAAGFYDIFFPICAAVRSGNFVAFQSAMAHNRDWLWAKGLYVTLFTRLKQLVWRSFTRRVFLLTWQQEPVAGGGGEMVNKAAVLALDHVVAAAQYVQKLLEGYVPVRQPAPRAAPPSGVSKIYLRAVSNSVAGGVDGHHALLAPPAGGRPRHLMPMEGLVFGNKRPEMETIEPIVANLVYAGFLNGFIARQSGRFAVEGAKKAGGNAVLAGWPNAWQSVMERFREDYEVAVQRFEAGEGEPPGEMDDVPGWVRNQGGA